MALIAPGPSKVDQRAAPINPENRRVVKSSQAAPAQPPCTTIPVEPAEQLNFDFGPAFPAPSDQAKRAVPTFSAKPDLFIFPLARRRPLILKLAAAMAAAAAVQGASILEPGENLLGGQLARLGRGLRRKRVPQKIIADELRALEREVRGELRHMSVRSRSDG